MAYIPTYEISFTNEQMNPVVITLAEKDGDAEALTYYDCVSARLSYNGDEGKVSVIYGMSLEVEYFVRTDQSDPTTVFVAAKKDTWLVTVTVDTKPFFTGYLLADEGGTPFQDLPYTAKFTAVDHIGLLKDIDLQEGIFTSHHSLIELAAYLLKQTGLQLSIRVRDYIYHESFQDRDDDIAADFFSQAFLEYRTFLKDALTFTDCYSALEMILKDNYRISQENGEWKITRLGMLQYNPFLVYETLYDANGENPVGLEVTDNYATVGKAELIYPHGEDQIKYIKKAVKSSRLNYNYDIWPELPRNNKFERGPLISTSTAFDESDIDGDGDFSEEIGTVKKYQINNWTWGQFSLSDFPDFTMNTGPVEEPLIHKVFNEDNLEIIREVSIPPSPSAGGDGIIVSGLKSDAVPVVQGDRIKFGLDKRFDADLHSGGDNNFSAAALVYIIPTGGGDPWFLLNSYTDAQRDGLWTNDFLIFTFFAGISIRFGDADTRRYASVTVESQPIPVTGDLTIILLNRGAGHVNYYRNFDLEYMPMVAGGFQKVKGDSAIIRQTNDYIDKSEEDTFLSDNPHKVFKGCLLNSAGIPLTPKFYRLGVTESKSYKAIANYTLFNFLHRRMDMIEGSFTSLLLNPENNQEQYYPVGLHWQYREMDMTGDIRFILCAPLEMDLVKGWITARFWEIYDSNHLAFDGTTNGTEEQKFIF